ncbi:hypothetical protein FNF27_07828 [Cafeteria roenbergensis]|uniref:Uncharacterized protein n=1 Tax=Cafeteria roenbergensis TaxID=33653 RepID=A0A5A8C502_CAFRO|nr:hypothetical protein FNF31_07554 [Cafeteria roenbergensis]KAA0163175.1 hypothetical protein FNF28_04400 [Cafeteria roenbergensis]KAA0164171.1 hypothetical protein FNF27_07828 [Cafeteria roenbergensis]
MDDDFSLPGAATGVAAAADALLCFDPWEADPAAVDRLIAELAANAPEDSAGALALPPPRAPLSLLPSPCLPAAGI